MHDADKLDPLELDRLHRGNEMLRQVAAARGAYPVVGPDGRAILPKLPAAGGKPVIATGFNLDDKAAARRQQDEEEFRRRQEMAVRINDLCNLCPDLDIVRSVMLLCEKLALWARMEASAVHPDMSDEAADLMQWLMRRSVYKNLEGFSIKEVVRQMESMLVRVKRVFFTKYETAGRRRKKQLDAIRKRTGSIGITMPCPAMTKALGGKPLFPGSRFGLYGTPEALRAALRFIGRSLCDVRSGPVCYLSTVAGESGTSYGFADEVMPPAWWKDSAANLSSFFETLKPLTDKGTLVLLVESLSDLIVSGNLPPVDQAVLAQARLHHWAVENTVAVIYGVERMLAVEPDRFFGPSPHLSVELEEPVGGRCRLLIGGDAFDIAAPLIVPASGPGKGVDDGLSVGDSHPACGAAGLQEDVLPAAPPDQPDD
jgi:hypothetical protein